MKWKREVVFRYVLQAIKLQLAYAIFILFKHQYPLPLGGEKQMETTAFFNDQSMHEIVEMAAKSNLKVIFCLIILILLCISQ